MTVSTDEKKIDSKQIKYHGSISKFEEIQKILIECDVLVCPSWSEGLPNVILEALANGLAVSFIFLNVHSLPE